MQKADETGLGISAGLRAGLAVIVVALSTAFAAGQAELRDRLGSLIENNADLRAATVGVSVRGVGATNTTLFSLNGNEPLLPASNMKLLTTGAALLVLKPDMHFETELGLRGQDLVIVGSGDPGLGDPALLNIDGSPKTADDFLDELAGVVAERGPRRLRSIIVDDRVFDREGAHPTWSRDQLNRWYSAEVAGVNFFTNVLTFYFEGDGVGGPPTLTVEPRVATQASWMTMDNAAEVVRGGQNTVWIARPRPANRFRAFGNVRRGTTARVHVAVHQPQLVFGYLLAERIASRGVRCGSGPDIADAVRLADADEDLTGAEPIAKVRTALTDALVRANTRSQNLYTEALIKRIGHDVTGDPGSWENGAAVIRMLLSERLGPDHTTSTAIADGSGLSRDNRVTPATLTAWLGEMLDQDTRTRRAFVGSLPTPGVGTLRDRFRDTAMEGEVRAKTGTIGGVRCLSGYVFGGANRSQDAVAFSVLINDVEGGRAVRAAKRLHEEIVHEIDAWLADRAASESIGEYGG